jgi:hypothetical protein
MDTIEDATDLSSKRDGPTAEVERALGCPHDHCGLGMLAINSQSIEKYLLCDPQISAKAPNKRDIPLVHLHQLKGNPGL